MSERRLRRGKHGEFTDITFRCDFYAKDGAPRCKNTITADLKLVGGIGRRATLRARGWAWLAWACGCVAFCHEHKGARPAWLDPEAR